MRRENHPVDRQVLACPPRAQARTRRAAIQHEVPYITTMSAAADADDAISALRSRTREVRSIQKRTGGLVAAHPAVIMA